MREKELTEEFTDFGIDDVQKSIRFWKDLTAIFLYVDDSIFW